MSQGSHVEDLERRVAELEAELADSRRVSDLLVHAPFGLYLVDLEGRVSATNERGASALGRTVAEIVGARLRDLYPPEVAERRRERGMAVFASGAPATFEDKIGDRCYLGTIVPIFDEHHRPTHLAIYGVDITERVWVEEALRRSQELLRAQRDLALALGQARGVSETLRLCLETAVKLSGMDCGGVYLVDAAPSDMELIAHVGVSDELVAAFGRLGHDSLHTRLAAKGEPLYSHSDEMPAGIRERLQAEGLRAVAILPIAHEGRPVGRFYIGSHTLDEVPDAARGTLETIAAQIGEAIARSRAEEALRRSESQLHQARKMEAIGTLAGGIAHDFNNLLMGIQGNASLMQLEAMPGERILDRIRSIEECVRSGTELTRQLLGFARGGRYEVRPTNINELIERSASLFGRTRKEISIHTKLERDLWVVDADRGQLEQVLLNLYVNAWQAMPHGGKLVLETRNVAAAGDEVARDRRRVMISVADTGVGMDEATKQRIFEPFFTTKEMGRGTGLGLATVYGIVKSHGGSITVDSAVGEGTVFTIHLPASSRTTAREPAVASRAVVRGSETVLLVDDEAMVLEVGGRMLEALGYGTITASSGAEALEVYQRRRGQIRVVVLDMIMPGLSGSETFDRLKEIDPGVQVLLSSGYSLDGQARAIFERGCKAFVQKPFSLDELSRKIREVLEG
jgi:signal transduction histidine kinase